MKHRLLGLIVACPTLISSVGGVGSAQASTEITLTPVKNDSICRYLNSAKAPAASWKESAFQDSTWTQGRMSFGHQEAVRTDIGRPEQTVYFRCSFQVDKKKYNPTALSVTARVDDGAVSYLNGREFSRTNMPAGSITHQTSASAVDNWDGRRNVTSTLDPAALRDGWNHYTVEVHQAANGSWRSSDLTFDSAVTIKAKPVQQNAAPQWKLAFSDEFGGSNLNTGNWKAYHNTYGDGDASLHCHTPSNVTVGGGTVKLTAKKEAAKCPNGKVRNYTGGFLGSRDVERYYPLYGRYEVRARTPHGQGLHPGFWLRHRNGASAAEVDVAEFFHSSKPGSVTQTVHFPTSLGYNVSKKNTVFEPAVQGRGGWHTYSVDILPVKPGDNSQVTFTFAIDGATTHSYTNKNTAAWTGTDPSASWDMALQLNVGGTWVGHPDSKLGFLSAGGGTCAQTFNKAPAGGNPANCPKKGIWLAPWQDSTFEVDYVRVYTPA